MKNTIKYANDFLNAVKKWTDWNRELLCRSEARLPIAALRPGMSHDGNLIIDADGHVWQSNWQAKTYEELTRAAPFTPYAKTGRTIPDPFARGETNLAYNGGRREMSDGVVFVAKAFEREQYEPDWAWTPARYGSDARHVDDDVRRARASITLGEAILKLKAEDIVTWTEAYPLLDLKTVTPEDGKPYTKRAVRISELTTLCNGFDIRFSFDNINDYGSISAACARLFDEAAGCGGNVTYMW